MTTLVSAFIPRTIARSDRGIHDYMDAGKSFLNLPLNKVLFTTPEIIQQYSLESDATTRIVACDRHNYLYDLLPEITHFNLESPQPEKDTLEFMILMCSKTEFVRRAALRQDFGSQQYCWVDFGLRYIFPTEDAFRNVFCTKEWRTHASVRMGSIWPPGFVTGRDLYTQICWYFAGGVFGGDARSLVRFANLVRDKCTEVVRTRHTLMWEVNVWYLVYLEHPDLFDCYPCDHNESLVSGY